MPSPELDANHRREAYDTFLTAVRRLRRQRIYCHTHKCDVNSHELGVRPIAATHDYYPIDGSIQRQTFKPAEAIRNFPRRRLRARIWPVQASVFVTLLTIFVFCVSFYMRSVETRRVTSVYDALVSTIVCVCYHSLLSQIATRNFQHTFRSALWATM